MPNFNLAPPPPPNKPKPKPKQQVQQKPDYIKTRGRFQVTDHSFYDSDIGNPNRKLLLNPNDYRIHFNEISFDGIHLSECGRFGIKYTKEHTYTLYHFFNPLTCIEDRQRLVSLRDDYETFVYQDKDDDVILGYIKTKLRDIVLKTRQVNIKSKKIEVVDEPVNEIEIEKEITDNVSNNLLQPDREQSTNNQESRMESQTSENSKTSENGVIPSEEIRQEASGIDFQIKETNQREESRIVLDFSL